MSGPSVSLPQHEYRHVQFNYEASNPEWTPTPRLTAETIDDVQARLERYREAAANYILEQADQAPLPKDQVEFTHELFGALDLPMKPFVILDTMSAKNATLINEVTGESWANEAHGRYFRQVELCAVDASRSGDDSLRVLIHEEAHGANTHTTVYETSDQGGLRLHFVAAVGRRKTDTRQATSTVVVGTWHDEAGCDLIGVNGQRLYRKENDKLPGNGDTSIQSKYSVKDGKGNILTSSSSFPAQGLELLIARKPELFEAALHAGQSAESMRDYIQIIDSFHPGLYQYLRNLPNSPDARHDGLKAICMVLGMSVDEALGSTASGKITEDLMAAKLDAYRRTKTVAPAAALVAIQKV